MRTISLLVLFAALTSGSAIASSHSEAPSPRGGAHGKTAEPTLLEQLDQLLDAVLGDEDAAAPTPPAPTVTVRRPGFEPAAR